MLQKRFHSLIRFMNERVKERVNEQLYFYMSVSCHYYDILWIYRFLFNERIMNMLL